MAKKANKGYFDQITMLQWFFNQVNRMRRDNKSFKTQTCNLKMI